MNKYFEFKDEKSSKFWEIELITNTLKSRFGKIGSQGQTTEKTFDSEADAKKEFEKLVKEKTKKGYIEITKDKENKTDSASHSAVANIPQELKGMSAEEIFSYSQCSFPDKNKKKTFEYTEIAAKLGSVNAMHTLGYLYQEGTGTKLNYTKAVECFENASKAGNIASYYSISICYLYGNGVERSDAKAHEYMLKAAELGYTRAMDCIGNDYHFGQSGLPKDYAAAARWYQKGAELGDDSCMEHLGYLYAHLEMPANLLEKAKKQRMKRCWLPCAKRRFNTTMAKNGQKIIAKHLS